MSPKFLAHLQGLLESFGEAIAAEVARNAVEAVLAKKQVPQYATAKNNPLGSPRSFLNAARANKFKSFKKGRETAAKWDEVAAYVESTGRTRRKQTSQADADIDRLYEETFHSKRSRRA